MSELSPLDPVRSPVKTRGYALEQTQPVTTPNPSDILTRLPDESDGSFPIANPPAPAPLRLPDFEILGELGRGGMGVVYKARQISLDRTVAIKMLLVDPVEKPTVLTRFLGEARAAACLSHPNIVAIYQIGECANGHFFAMEYVKGPTLQRVLEKQGEGKPLPVRWSVKLIASIAEAVHYAHSRGIVHRDLKPANILLDRTGRPVVMDFGIAKRLDQPSGLTQSGVIVGTPAFMPPEQAGEGGGVVGPHSDVYALGAILYRLLTGRLPYEADTALSTLLLVAGADLPPPVRKLRGEVPLQLSMICMKCLNKAPTDRYSTAEELARELKNFNNRAAGGSSATLRRPVVAVPPGIVLEAADTGKKVRLSANANVIGRGSDCDMVIKAPDVSKRHCRILIDGKRVEIEDLDSVNGTCVNRQQVTRSRLRDGDRIEIAGHCFTIHLEL